jgi:uncharacterized protein DUF6894
MPRFFFDLIFDQYVVLDPGGMLFEHATGAAAAADEMARHLVVSRPELRNSGGWIRVRDQRRNEVCQSSINPDAAEDSTSQAFASARWAGN